MANESEGKQLKSAGEVKMPCMSHTCRLDHQALMSFGLMYVGQSQIFMYTLHILILKVSNLQGRTEEATVALSTVEVEYI